MTDCRVKGRQCSVYTPQNFPLAQAQGPCPTTTSPAFVSCSDSISEPNCFQSQVKGSLPNLIFKAGWKGQALAWSLSFFMEMEGLA